jgi:hypothetical protein
MLFRQRMELEGITEIDFPWLAEVKKFLASPSIGETVVPPEISPCCHLSNLLHPQSKGQSSEKRKWVSLDFDDCPVDGCRVVDCRLDDSQEKCNNVVSSSRRKKTTERSKKTMERSKKTMERSKKQVICDGCFLVPNHRLMVAPSFKHVDVLSLARQVDSGEPGLLHGVMQPNVACFFEEQGLLPRTDPGLDLIADFRCSNSFRHPINKKEVCLKLRISMYQYHGSDALAGQTLTCPKVYQDQLHLMTEAQCETERRKFRSDVWIILGAPSVQEGDFHVVTARFLSYDYSQWGGADTDALYNFFHCHLPKKGLSTDRVGGSNGTSKSINSKALLKFLRLPGITPRQSKSVLVIPKGFDLHVFYVNPYGKKKVVKHYKYAIPTFAGQLRLCKSWLKKAPECVYTILEMQVSCKVLMGAIAKSLNAIIKTNGWSSVVTGVPHKLKKYHNYRLLCQEAVVVQEATNHRVQQLFRPEQEIETTFFLAATTKISVVESALFHHKDITHKHADHPKLSAFFEPKTLHVVANKSHDKTFPPLGRGGAGRGKYVFALLDHSFGETTGDWRWAEFRDRHALPMTLAQFLDWIRTGRMPEVARDHVREATRAQNEYNNRRLEISQRDNG